MAIFASKNKKVVAGSMITAAVVATFTVFASTMASAKRYVVGDEKGWTKDFDYTTWTVGKQFFVGDSLVFNYTQGDHNVFEVSGWDSRCCSKPSLGAPLTTGSDEIELKTTGGKWYICYASGQKLFISVSDGSGAAPAPTPATGGVASGSMGISAGFVAAVVIVVGVVGMVLLCNTYNYLGLGKVLVSPIEET